MDYDLIFKQTRTQTEITIRLENSYGNFLFNFYREIVNEINQFPVIKLNKINNTVLNLRIYTDL